MADVIAPADEPKPEPEKPSPTQNEFAAATQPEPQQPEIDPGSDQVKNHQLGLHKGPKPPGGSEAIDRQAHNAALAKDHEKAKQINEQRLALHEKYNAKSGEENENSVQLNSDRSNDQDQGR